jgi:hypothetical protein
MTPSGDHPWTDETTSIEAIQGWRLWQVVPWERSQHRLAAWSLADLVWPAHERCESTCLRVRETGHLAPQPRCGCGLYAFRSRSLAEAALASEMRPGTVALGRVSLWGRVVEHGSGWRAQYGYPYELLLIGDEPAVARELRAAYAVDVAWLDVPGMLRRVRAERRKAYEERMGGLAA